MIGLQNLPSSVASIVRELAFLASPKKIILFGSRARGDARQNSDFDLCIVEKSCSDEEFTRLYNNLIELPNTLYQIDLIEFEKVSTAYQENILKEGVTLYEL